MRRFYCVVCKRVRRVRVIPTSTKNTNAENPEARIGQCRWHDGEPRHPAPPPPKVRPSKVSKTPTPVVNANAKSKGKHSREQR
jgi:hypothetical protein